MVTAPPQSGKTSLLQLLEKEAFKSQFFTFVLYLDMAEVQGSLQQALEPHCLDWEGFLAASREGMRTSTHSKALCSICSLTLHVRLCNHVVVIAAMLPCYLCFYGAAHICRHQRRDPSPLG